MKPLRSSFLLSAVLISGIAFSRAEDPDSFFERGKQKFEQVCFACHKYERGPAMIAPPAFAIQMHYGDRYGKDEAAFREAVIHWARLPDRSKTLMPGAITKFNLMPPLPLPDADLDMIAAYLYRADFTGECDVPMRNRNSEL
ncbi:cytochrome c [Pelagicoccus sp. SDUM812002]|uniref:cytochrome c n=1 Tax=Pelagicoccus sp. SDUM812002 TaxID=3041266 RepID=UPI00280E4694|nr:cytochrome c [Pelagicoccus sp. SDUM812002]MDQ8184669.1 cytochrome c [Pelagicoccus sp. SDUM812002]